MPSRNNLRSRRNQSTFVPPQGPVPVSSIPAHHDHDTPAERTSSTSKATSTILPARPLASLSFISLLRSILLHTVSASPILLFLTTKILTANIEKLHLDNPFNPLGQLLYHTFYKHFCAGRNQSEIESVVNTLRERGLAGVILSYAREVDVSDNASSSAEDEHRHMQLWLEGTKRTVEYTPPGDFVAVKFSGAGLAALKLVGSNPPRKPTLELATGLEDICELAVERDVRLLIDAEHAREQEGMDEWTLDLMRKYNNRRSDGKAVVYNTYQMYLKSAPSKLAQHLSLAQSENWPLGVKLVRGAYLSSDPRELICDSQADTDKQYDDAVQMLLDSSSHGAKVDLCVATHNKESLRKAKAAVAAIKPGENRRIQEITYAQLMGMADELSLGLAQQNKNEKGKVGEETKVYKYVVWGSISECVKYLLRRAEENQSAAGRSKENVEACWEEIKFRMGLKRLRG